jgi:diketogulonate reductase-like aldo/keto reductase
MGFQVAPRAIEAQSLLDCAVLTTPHHPSQIHIDVSGDDANAAILMPWVGFGTYRLGKNKSRSATLEALKVGYRHIDTAFVYGGQTTEIEVGLALQDALQQGIIKSRQDVFITTKQWREYHGYDASMNCLELSLERLGVDYVDCWMMHWPGPCWSADKRERKKSKSDASEETEDNDPWLYAQDGMGIDEITTLRAETWRAMEDAYRQGKTRSIAVSNFTIQHLKTLKQSATLWPPAINQIESHPYYPQNDLIEYCQKEGIVIQAYAALGGQDGTKAKWKALGGKLIESAPILKVSKRLNKTPAQVLLRWSLQRNCAVVPKTCNPSRMIENKDIFDFRLSDEDMHLISSLSNGVGDEEGRLCWRTEPLRMPDRIP